MKNMKKTLLSCLLLMGMFCWIGGSENVVAQSSKHFDLDNKSISYQLKNNKEIVILVNNIGKYDTVTLEGQATSTNIEVKGWEVFYSNFSANRETAAASQIEKITGLTKEMLSFDGNKLLVNNVLEDNKRSAIHIRLPLGSRVKVYVNNELIHNGTFSKGEMLQGNKTVSSNRGYSSKATILQAISQGASDKETIHKIDAQVLRRLVTKPSNVASIENKNESWAMLQVTVNPLGIVGNIFYVGGDSKLASICAESLKNFIFQPFLVEGKAVTVTSLVGVSAKDGQIKLFSAIPK